MDKAFIKKTFNGVAGGYDHPAMRFFPKSAEYFISCLNLSGDETVLDVATGTGWVALALARQLTSGSVTGIDLSDGMLEIAKRKSDEMGISNALFKEMDMQKISFPENTFSDAVCAFGIFFVKDMCGLVSHIASRIKPDGRFIASTFYENSFSPFSDKLFSRLEVYGVKIPEMPWLNVAREEQCVTLFEQAGLKDVSCEKVYSGYYLKDASEWWNIAWNGGYRGLINQLPPEELETFRDDHLKEIETLSTSEGIYMDMSILYTAGRKL